MVSNIIDLNPNFNQSEGTYKIKWNTNKILIGGKKTLIYQILDDSSHNNILFLHAYGEGCDGRDWNLHVSYHLKNIKSNFYSVDFPGFGESEGKKFTSRA
jgi:pimeloyl-ACP methyl ester carboxylesterase